MKTIRFTPMISLLAAGLLMSGCVAVGHQNPADSMSNPNKLAYTDVEARSPNFNEVFVRDGFVSNPADFRKVTPGMRPEQVRQMLGQPLKEGQGSRGQEWDYNFKFRMPESNNYLVCQYKVVLDAQRQAVREAVWRRKQCLDLVAAAP